MYGIIDIGSNTMRLSCYKVVEKQLIHIFHKKDMAGLAGYVDENNCLSDAGIQKAVSTLEDFRNIVTCVGLDKLYVIATASLRNINNTKEVVNEILDKTGMQVQVLSGKEEAMYDFKGASYCTDFKSGIVVDIGGGSTELVCFNNKEPESAVSLPIGSLNTFSKFVENLFPNKKEEDNIRKYVKEKLEDLNDLKKQKLVIGVGGTIRACTKLYNDYYDLHSKNTILDCERISAMLAKINDGKKSEMTKILKIVPDRIHTIIPGMILLDEINNYYKCRTIQLSAWGVREGYMIEKVL